MTAGAALFTRKSRLIVSLAGEFFGTTFFVLAIIVPIIVTEYLVAPGLTGSALSGALALMGLVAAGIYTTGGHYNPAVTVAAWVAGITDTMRALAYIGVQMIGGLVAVLMVISLENRLEASFPAVALEIDTNLGANYRFTEAVSNWEVIGFEFVATFALAWVIVQAAADIRSKPLAPLAAGGILYVALLIGSVYTGAGLNPARILGPIVFSGFNVGLDFFLLIMITPLVASAVAGLLARTIRNARST